MSVENCKNCAFGVQEWVHSGREIRCHRRAPLVAHTIVGISSGSPLMGDKTLWPKVSDTDFCGEFELKDAG